MGTLKMEGTKLRVGTGTKLRRNFKSPLLQLKYLNSTYFYSFISHPETIREEDWWDMPHTLLCSIILLIWWLIICCLGLWALLLLKAKAAVSSCRNWSLILLLTSSPTNRPPQTCHCDDTLWAWSCWSHPYWPRDLQLIWSSQESYRSVHRWAQAVLCLLGCNNLSRTG